LHFIFYDFAKKSFPDTLGKMNTEQGKFWDIAEVFNVVIQSNKEFVKLHGKVNKFTYPDHEGLIKKGKDFWQKNRDVYRWIFEMLKIV
jgi:hypothetical protein